LNINVLLVRVIVTIKADLNHEIKPETPIDCNEVIKIYQVEISEEEIVDVDV